MKTVIEMAREAGLPEAWISDTGVLKWSDLERFAKLVRADERAKMAEQPAQHEPVAMRMPKVGDEVICIEDDSLGTVAYLTAGGSPEIRFDDGSHGTYMLREFAELFRYTPSPAQRTWVNATTWRGLTDEEIESLDCVYLNWLDYEQVEIKGDKEFARAIEAKLKEKNT